MMKTIHKLGIFAIFALIFLATLYGALAQERHDYVRMLENRQGFTDPYTVYEVCNPKDEPLTAVDASDFGMMFIDEGRILSSYSYAMKVRRDAMVPVYSETCSPYQRTDANLSKRTVQNCTKELVSYAPETTYSYEPWSPMGKTFRPGECYHIKVSGRLRPDLGPRPGVDNILTYSGISFTEYAWWNQSCAAKASFNVMPKAVQAGQSLLLINPGSVINMSYGYAVRNDTDTEIPFYQLNNLSMIWVNASVTAPVHDFGIDLYYNCSAATPQHSLKSVLLPQSNDLNDLNEVSMGVGACAGETDKFCNLWASTIGLNVSASYDGNASFVMTGSSAQHQYDFSSSAANVSIYLSVYDSMLTENKQFGFDFRTPSQEKLMIGTDDGFYETLSGGATSAPRSLGWHEFRIWNDGTRTFYYIDGINVQKDNAGETGPTLLQIYRDFTALTDRFDSLRFAVDLGSYQPNVTYAGMQVPPLTYFNISVSYPLNSTYGSRNYTFSATVNTTMDSTCRYSLNGDANVSMGYGSGLTATGLSALNQSNRLSFSCNTSALWSFTNLSFTVNAMPICSFIANQTWDKNTNRTLGVTGYCSDPDSGFSFNGSTNFTGGVTVYNTSTSLIFSPVSGYTTSCDLYYINVSDPYTSDVRSNTFCLEITEPDVLTTGEALTDMKGVISLMMALALFFVMLVFSEIYGGLYYLATVFIGIGVFMLLARQYDSYVSVPFLLFVIVVLFRMIFKFSKGDKR